MKTGIHCNFRAEPGRSIVSIGTVYIRKFYFCHAKSIVIALEYVKFD